MNTRSLIIIVSTLLIGMVLGFLTAVVIRHRKVEQYKAYSGLESFRDISMRSLQPSDEQMEDLAPVIDRYARRNQQLMMDYREEFYRLMVEYRDEVEPLLTEEQKRMILERPRRGMGPGRGPAMRWPEGGGQGRPGYHRNDSMRPGYHRDDSMRPRYQNRRDGEESPRYRNR